MHSPSHAACIYQLGSFWFNLQGLTRASFYTSQRLHQPAFTQTPFYTKHFLQKFTQISFYTNQLYTNQLLDKPPFTMCKPPFTPTSFTQPRLWACWPKARARGPAECPRLLNTCLSIHLCTYMFIPAESLPASQHGQLWFRYSDRMLFVRKMWSRTLLLAWATIPAFSL